MRALVIIAVAALLSVSVSGCGDLETAVEPTLTGDIGESDRKQILAMIETAGRLSSLVFKVTVSVDGRRGEDDCTTASGHIAWRYPDPGYAYASCVPRVMAAMTCGLTCDTAKINARTSTLRSAGLEAKRLFDSEAGGE